MSLDSERKEIVHFGRQMVRSGLTTGTGGNLSIFNPDKRLVAISPSGVDYDDMRPEDVAVVTPGGYVESGDKKPSSELSFHLALYNKRPDIGAIIHTHSVYATTFACLGEEIPAVHYLVGFSGKKVPLARYATFGSSELAEYICESIGEYNATLLANHGLVAVGPDLSYAFSVAEEIELVARIYYQARCIGNPQILSDLQMNEVMEKFKTYGRQD